jgi:hypothetical protein
MKLPTVTCICITRERRFLLRRAVHYFERAARRYPGFSELVIVDGSDEKNPEYPGHRYVHLPEPPHDTMYETRIGAYTNVACQMAQGDIVIKWDDDDWQHPDRIRRQVATIAAYDDALTFTSLLFWYHLSHRMASVGHGAGGGTLAFHRSAWLQNPFPDKGVEDTPFCAEHQKRGWPFLDAKDPLYYIYVRHRANTSGCTSPDFQEEATALCRRTFEEFGDMAFYDEMTQILSYQPWNNPNAQHVRMARMTPLERVWARHQRP